MSKRFANLILLAVIIFQALTHLFWLPISAHSGQLAIPWMLNNGLTLFDNILEQHAPASSLLAAFIQQILPFEAIDTLRLMNLALVLAITVLVYVLTLQYTKGNRIAAISAVLFWAWWEPVYGNILFYFDTLVGLCVLLALVIWGMQRPRHWLIPLCAGIVMGTATIFKQHAWGAVILFLLWIILFDRSWKNILLYLVGTAILPALLILRISTQGNLETYLYWNWTYNLSGFMDGVPLSGAFLRKVLLTNVFAVPFIIMTWQNWRERKEWILLIIMWMAGLATIFPRAGEIHVMAHLPLLAVMTGITFGALMQQFRNEQAGNSWLTQLHEASISTVVLIGFIIALGLGWLWTGLVAYVPTPVGMNSALAYAEYDELVSLIESMREDGDTLFVLPETDSTPQLHPRTNMLPSTTWIKGWRWYFAPEGIVDDLLAEWNEDPPTFVVVFPGLLTSGEPGITPFVNFVEDNYESVGEVEEVYGHQGGAIVYRLRE